MGFFAYDRNEYYDVLRGVRASDRQVSMYGQLAKQDQQIQDQQQQSELNKKKEAEAILNALRDKEKINQKFQIKKAASRKMEKDW